MKVRKDMTRLLLTAAVTLAFAPGAASCQEQLQLHRIDARTPDGLRQLLHYDGCNMPLLSAHRGGAVPGYPENCIATFEHTLRHCFSILEIDLQSTKDGHLVLHHDTTLDRTTTGTGVVANRTLWELQQLRLRDNDGNVTDYRMPTLDEALQWARGKTILILDKKDVPIEVCVEKIQKHQAQAYAMVMAYRFEDIQTCHKLDPDIMMEVMIGNRQRLRGWIATGVPWDRIIAFVGHAAPQDKDLVQQIHARGVCCVAGTSRNLDRHLGTGSAQVHEELKRSYQERLDFGVDLIETDLPIQVAALLYAQPKIPRSKARFFQIPTDSGNSR
jgi:glycerophosphoryl diester phosphodiesterase